jgi:hypothetical protein
MTNNYENLLSQIDEISDYNKLKDYHSFIYWFIETTTEFDKQKILDSICDGTHDKGIDAIIIDNIEGKVKILQSKFERDGNKVQVSESDIKLLASVKDYFRTRKTLNPIISNANPDASRLMNEAFDTIRNKSYPLELIFITTHKNAPQLNSLIHETLGFKKGEFSVFHYEQIMQLFLDRLRDFTPPLGPYCLPYVDSDKCVVRTSSKIAKSWVLTVPLEEIKSMVNKYGDKLFRKNVRNFLGSNKCNQGIQETLENHPNNFWYYNNGVCILCDEGSNLDVENKFMRLVNPQIVNGCQTAKSIEKFKGEVAGDVLVRVIESNNHEFISAITLYQNSSNPVKKRDFKSNDPVQIRLKNELRLQHWYYEIKRGEEFKKMLKKQRSMRQFYRDDTFGDRVLNNEQIAKLRASIELGPATSLSKGSEAFFDELYDDIFPSTLSTIDCLAPHFVSSIIKNTYYGNGRFHSFKSAWIFKTRAAPYVLSFIYNSLKNKKDWERIFISYYQPDAKDYKKFYKEIKNIVDDYFELIYNSWKKSKEPDHNTYLQSEKTLKNIKSNYKNQINKLSRAILKAFEKFVLD